VEVQPDKFVFLSINYLSNIIKEDSLEYGTKRLLEVDNRILLPYNVPLRILITAGDVLHS